MRDIRRPLHPAWQAVPLRLDCTLTSSGPGDALNDRLISGAVGLLMAGMAALFSMGACVSYDELRLESDYEHWVKSPGTLRMLEISQTLHRLRWQYTVACEYEFEFNGKHHVARRYDLKGVIYPTREEAKAAVESQLGIAGRARWSRVQQMSSDDWALDARGIAITVRHSPRNPSATTLTATPPMMPWLNWLLIVVLGLLALVTALGCLVMTVFTVRPQDQRHAG
jgi:hypothetical protein